MIFLLNWQISDLFKIIFKFELFFVIIKGYQGMVDGGNHIRLATWASVSGIMGWVLKKKKFTCIT